ncbi:MAG: protein-L-isoaspartate O-methyltransferase [Phycisphaerales bacterium]
MTEIEAAAERMVSTQLVERGIRHPAVLDAMRAVPRHRFVPDVSIEKAYSDHALPTTGGQTISQPYIVARMTELLCVQPGMKVLEIGTGSGYQTAILARMGASVVTIERSPELMDRARQVLAEVCSGMDIRMLLTDGTARRPRRAVDRIPAHRCRRTSPTPAMNSSPTPAGSSSRWAICHGQDSDRHRPRR